MQKNPKKLIPKTTGCFKVTEFPAVEHRNLVWTCLIPGENYRESEIFSATEKSGENEMTLLLEFAFKDFNDALRFDFSIEGTTSAHSDFHVLRTLASSECKKVLREININNS